METSAIQKVMETEMEMEMEMEEGKGRKQSKDKQMTRKKKNVNWFGFLSDDMVLEILKRLPEDFLRYKAKYVNKRWFNIVTNRILRDHASFILQTSYDSTVRLVDLAEERQGLEVKVQNVEIPLGGRIVSWCNEYLLVTDLEKHEYVYNVFTKEGAFIPHCESCGGAGVFGSDCTMALYFDGFKGVYKVLHVLMGPPVQCHVLVLRRHILSRLSSKWEKIEFPFHMDEERYYWGDPISVQARYFHWLVRGDTDRRYLVSMDMVKEKVFRTSLPISESTFRVAICEMSGFLTLIHQVPAEQTDMWCDIPFLQGCCMWILKDFETMKWEKLAITISEWWYFGQYLDSCSDIVSGVKSMRYLTCIRLSSWDGAICSYDLKDGDVKELDIPIGSREHRVVHSSSPSFI